MEKYFIIALVIFIIINLILMIPIEVRIVKRFDRPILFRVLLFNHIIFQKIKIESKKSEIKFKLSYIFETDLNKLLKELKNENFFITLMLEYAKIKKVTVIPTFNSSNPLLLPYFGVMDWMLVATIKKYIDSTFKNVENEYYQIIILKDDMQGLNFEICTTITLFNLVFEIIKNFKVFLKTIRKKEKKYE